MADMEGIFAIVGVFGVVPLTVWAVSAYRHRSHRDSMNALARIAETDQAVTPELVESMGVRRCPENADLRTGAVLLAIGVFVLILGLAVPDDNGSRAGMVFSLLPLLLGAVFIGLWKYTQKTPPPA